MPTGTASAVVTKAPSTDTSTVERAASSSRAGSKDAEAPRVSQYSSDAAGKPRATTATAPAAAADGSLSRPKRTGCGARATPAPTLA